MTEDHLTFIEAWPKCYPFYLFITHVPYPCLKYKHIFHTLVSGFISVRVPLSIIYNYEHAITP